MIPWQQLAQADVPGEKTTLVLSRRGSEFAIRIGTGALMSSLTHGSEEALAELALARIAGRAQARVLIGGLGMGYTLAAALKQLGPSAHVEVAELIPAVVEWNRGPLEHLADRPLADRRVAVWVGDVGDRIRAAPAAWDAILLDVDNGPEGLTRQANDALYSSSGLKAAHTALRPGGVLAVWSSGPDLPFAKRLDQAGFDVNEVRVRATGRGGGARHIIWIATKD